VESNDLNARDDLTMWKRFNGSDAIRQSVYAVLLAEAGAEGAVRPFEGNMGFLAKVGVPEEDIEWLFGRLGESKPPARVTENTFKRWPVGSRGQSAIQASLQARAGVADIWKVKKVRVFADEGVYDHLVTQRAEPWKPTSRETADHSLPYIVAAAVLDGQIKVSSFDQGPVLDPKRQKFLAEKVVVEPSKELTKGGKGGYLSRVEIVDADERVHVGEAKAPPGHTLNPFTNADFDQKFHDNVDPLYGAARVAQIVKSVWSLESVKNVRELTRQLKLDDPSGIS
jgi:2-methylcitrate dehydratase